MLTRDGLSQMGKTAMKLHQIRGTDQCRTLILSSPAPRALASANVLSAVLKAPVEEHVVLWSDMQHRARIEEAYDLIQGVGRCVNFVVAVTHLELAEDLPEVVGNRVGINVLWESDVLNGQGVFLDYSSKTSTPLKW